MSDESNAAAGPPLPSAELSCQELVELVTAYLDGALGPVERTRFEEHLAACPGCTIHLDQVRRTIAALGHLTEETLPPAARERLLEAFRSWKLE
jgi:anti-sigma factor (TIGR02949 family)